jgi:hypothetical protein
MQNRSKRSPVAERQKYSSRRGHDTADAARGTKNFAGGPLLSSGSIGQAETTPVPLDDDELEAERVRVELEQTSLRANMDYDGEVGDQFLIGGDVVGDQCGNDEAAQLRQESNDEIADDGSDDTAEESDHDYPFDDVADTDCREILKRLNNTVRQKFERIDLGMARHSAYMKSV